MSDKWIRVQDALPSEPNQYIVALDGEAVCHGWYDPTIACTTDDGIVLAGPWLIVESFFADNDNPEVFVPAEFLNCSVTHWQPLPDAPVA